MAEVDFSNAIISIGQSNALDTSYLGINSAICYTSTNRRISQNESWTLLNLTLDECVARIQGEFTLGGTEFYFGMGNSGKCWKVSNVSFSSHDTYDFTARIKITEKPSNQMDVTVATSIRNAWSGGGTLPVTVTTSIRNAVSGALNVTVTTSIRNYTP